VEVEKIFKSGLLANSQPVYAAIFQKGDLVGSVTQMIKKERLGAGRFGRGYTGCLTNIVIALQDCIQKPT
jgi:hypothetical protein